MSRKRYWWTDATDQILRDHYDSRIKGRAASIALGLGTTTKIVKRRAAQLGIQRRTTAYANRVQWTAHMDALLTPTCSAAAIAKTLGLNKRVVMYRMHTLGVRCYRSWPGGNSANMARHSDAAPDRRPPLPRKHPGIML